MTALANTIAIIASIPKHGEPEYEGAEFRQDWEDSFGKYAIEALHDAIDQARAVLPVADRYAALLAFVEQMARMTTPEDEFSEMQEQAPDVIAANEYEDADDMVADFSDDRLGGEYETFMTMVAEARKLLA